MNPTDDFFFFLGSPGDFFRLGSSSTEAVQQALVVVVFLHRDLGGEPLRPVELVPRNETQCGEEENGGERRRVGVPVAGLGRAGVDRSGERNRSTDEMNPNLGEEDENLRSVDSVRFICLA
jgi:hypothetical protein